MSTALQGPSAFQASLLDTGDDIHLHPLGDGLHRTQLSRGAWVDYRPGWLAGADVLFEALHHEVPWYAERREMYERMVDVPRLLKFYDEDEPLPHPVLTQAREELSRWYAAQLGEPFVTAGMCLYRDGRDSVAWHGDRVGRAKDLDTMVGILSIGSARTLSLRPRGGGHSIGFSLGHGDLVVMGGSCQRTWEHAIPKTTKAVGPRISIQFRPRGIR
ncbi:alkylated DNA repair dioxygenase AlkB [Phycicoccus badiiscoriae]|uniref:Alkylated DNA repair dioxygenase AlkB n=1 Tax=Pedococcus badiiscoriae TaxID=642776 RepID=A0A852WS54_9MICO|nr:alpha-ketoglutarate-dependent dioxygenase AlkB [Pedococcus badiiscoriae]NYG08136.1 alkylated DNA repair dioxygenase AlkB [Pedococcus badiiscoriae]